jgi:hypothetical protein
MKNSKEYCQKIQELYRRLKREYEKPEKITYDEPVDALVYAIISENRTETETQSAIKKLTEWFADWNELRACRPDEVVEALGSDGPVAKETASVLIKALMAVFGRYHSVSLKSLKKIGKRPARVFLEKIEGTSVFVVDFCMLTSLQGHAIPLTKKMIEYLKNNGLVHPQSSEEEIAGFLARQIPAENAYEFYIFLKRCSETGKVSDKAARRTKTKKKGTAD